MTDPRIQKYEAMWTTDRHRYGMIVYDDGETLLMELSSGGLIAFDDEHDVYATVLANMRSAGVRVLKPEEARPRPTTTRG